MWEERGQTWSCSYVSTLTYVEALASPRHGSTSRAHALISGAHVSCGACRVERNALRQRRRARLVHRAPTCKLSTRIYPDINSDAAGHVTLDLDGLVGAVAAQRVKGAEGVRLQALSRLTVRPCVVPLTGLRGTSLGVEVAIRPGVCDLAESQMKSGQSYRLWGKSPRSQHRQECRLDDFQGAIYRKRGTIATDWESSL